MLEPSTSQPHEQIAQLQAQLAGLKREKAGLQARLEACQLAVRSPAAEHLQRLEGARDPAQGTHDGSNGSTLEPRLLAATATAAHALLTIAPLDAAVKAALQILGEALDTDRLTVIENFNPSDSSFVWWGILYEWTSPYAMPQITHPDLARGSYEGMEEWYALLRQGQGISCLLEEMPEPFRSGQAALGVKALHAVPIFVEGKYWGVIGFDDCRRAMHRSLAALDVLKIIANCIGSAIQRDCAQQARIQAEQERAAELAKANEALKRSLDALATDPDLNRFIGHVLSIVAEQLDAPVSEYWSHSGKVASLELSCWQGEIASHEQLARDPRTQGIEILPEIVSDEKLEQRRRHFVIDDLPGDPLQLALFSALDFDLEAWCETHGVRRHLNVPLRLGERTIGALTVYIPAHRSFTQQQIELAYALAQQVTLAVQLTQLAEAAKQAAIAREQEQAAQARAAELAKANTALQRVIDALTAIDDLDEFVPATLRIVAQAFETENCAFYEHGDKAPIYLRYWLMGDRVLRPDDLVTLDSESLATVRRLAAGFTVPDAHLGTSVRNRTRAVILDHTCATSEPEFHEFACRNGWAIELNVPLVVDGHAEGALLIYRPAGTIYTPAEIGLAEALGKQLALAMQASRLATEKRSQAVETAIAREQEQAAQARAAELAKANEALRRGVERLAKVGNIDALLDSFLLEAMTVTGASAGAVFSRVADTEFQMRSLAQDGRLINSADTDAFGSILRAVSARDPVGVFRQIIEAQVYCHDVDDYYASWFPEAAAFHRQQGNQVTWNFPFRIGDKVVGFLGLAFREKRWPNQVMSETVQALGHQVSLALETLRLAEEAKKAAIAREQERAALERATVLEKVNEVLRRRSHEVQRSYRILEATAQATDALLTIHDFDQAVNTALQILGESLETDRTKVLESLLDDPSRPFSRHHNVLYEWTSPGTVRQLSHPQGKQIDTRGRMEDFWERFLQTNGFGGLLEEWDESLHAAFQLLEVKSLYVVPIRVNGQWWGILAFDDCREAKDRPEAEMAVLQTVANCIGSAIQRQRMQREQEKAERQVLLEREKAAQERAVALATANIALRAEVIERDRAERSARGQAEALVSMLTAFAAAPVLDNFLGIVLQAIVEQIGGHSGGIWLYDDCQNTSILHLNYEDGQIQQGSQITRPGTKPGFLKQWDRDYLSALKQQKLLIQDRRQPIDSPAYADYHTYNQQRGIQMILVVALFFGETFLGNITLRCTDYRDCKPEELALIQALAQQAALVIQLTRLAEQSKQAAILEERNRMAREIHDTLAQSFTSIRMQLEAAIRLLNCKPEQAQACITFAQELAKSGLAEARRSVWALQPEAEDYRHLSTALQRLAAQQTAETSIQVEVVIIGTPYALPPDVGMNLLRIGQEALNNALHHASAQTILTLTYDSHQVQLQIQDDGQGFDPQLESSGGFGLISMKQRSDRLGGTFTIKSQPGHGTEIRVTVPI